MDEDKILNFNLRKVKDVIKISKATREVIESLKNNRGLFTEETVMRIIGDKAVEKHDEIER